MAALATGKVAFAIAVTAALTIGIVGGLALSNSVLPRSSNGSPNPEAPQVLLHPASTAPCSWHDNPFEGMDAQESAGLTLIDACGKLTGTVTQIVVRVKGEETVYHFILLPDAQYASMANSVNQQQFGGGLVIEVLASDSSVMPKLHVDERLEVEGPHVTDIEKGWNEIHPAKIIETI
jgi:hypothetical protein